MQAPVQVPPVPRFFMQPIVGREWAPGAEQKSATDAPVRPEKEKKSRKKAAASNPCLIQLTTIAVLRLRPPFWGIVS